MSTIHLGRAIIDNYLDFDTERQKGYTSDTDNHRRRDSSLLAKDDSKPQRLALAAPCISYQAIISRSSLESRRYTFTISAADLSTAERKQHPLTSFYRGCDILKHIWTASEDCAPYCCLPELRRAQLHYGVCSV